MLLVEHCVSLFTIYNALLLTGLGFCFVRLRSFDLMNEPRAPGDTSGDILQEWFDYTSWYFKQVDTNHLLTTGMEASVLISLVLDELCSSLPFFLVP